MVPENQASSKLELSRRPVPCMLRSTQQGSCELFSAFKRLREAAARAGGQSTQQFSGSRLLVDQGVLHRAPGTVRPQIECAVQPETKSLAAAKSGATATNYPGATGPDFILVQGMGAGTRIFEL